MFKNFVLAALFVLFTSPVWAVGPSQQWRLDITGAENGIVEVAEVELHTTEGGSSAIDLFRTFTYEESSPAGSTTWSIPHNLGIQLKTGSATIIANAVDVVAPGDWFYNPNTFELYQRTNLAYDSVDFVSGPTNGEPANPEVGDVFFDNVLETFEQWNGFTWEALTVTSTTSALPVPDSVTPTSVTFVPAAGVPATGGPAANNTVEIVFPEAVVGAATIRGASFDTPSSNKPGTAVPIIEGFENRPAAAAFDGNKGSWFKSNRAPTLNSPLSLEYTYWVGDPSRYPNVVEYAITAVNKDSAPKNWKLMMNKDGAWVTVDQQSSIRFDDGETRTFSVE